MGSFTMQQIQDYLRCPMMYNLRYRLKMEAPINVYDAYERLMNDTIAYMYYNIMDNHTLISSAQFKRKWESLWWPDDVEDPMVFVLTPMYGSIPKDGRKSKREGIEARRKRLALEGWSILNNLHRQVSANPGEPIAVQHEFTLPIGEHHVSSQIDLAQIVKMPIGQRIELVHFYVRRNTPDAFEVRNNLKTTFQSYAFRQLFQTREDTIIYYYLHKGERLSTHRDKRDFSRLEAILDNVCTSIEQQLFFPRHSFYCDTCYLQDPCSQWGK